MSKFIDEIDVHKVAGDRFKIEIEQLRESRDDLASRFEETKEYVVQMLQERDTLRDDMNQLQKIKEHNQQNSHIVQQLFKVKNNSLETKNQKLAADLKMKEETFFKTDKQNRVYADQVQKLRAHVTKLLQRKGKMDQDFKQCKNCGNEYYQKENFNWSCRVHQSEWGGEMWWCCGKRNKDAPGCKFN